MTKHRSTTPPDRSLEQRRAALKRANDVRAYRKALKRDIRAGQRLWTDVLDDELVQTMHVAELLVAVPGVARVKANRILIRARVSASKTIGGLTDRQRIDIVEAARATPNGERRTGTITLNRRTLA